MEGLGHSLSSDIPVLIDECYYNRFDAHGNTFFHSVQTRLFLLTFPLKTIFQLTLHFGHSHHSKGGFYKYQMYHRGKEKYFLYRHFPFEQYSHISIKFFHFIFRFKMWYCDIFYTSFRSGDVYVLSPVFPLFIFRWNIFAQQHMRFSDVAFIQCIWIGGQVNRQLGWKK